MYVPSEIWLNDPDGTLVIAIDAALAVASKQAQIAIGLNNISPQQDSTTWMKQE